MSGLQSLLIVAVLGQTPVDPAELDEARSALESYYGKIMALQITYSEKSAAPPAYQRENPNWDPTLVNDHDLLWAYPSLRMKVVVRRKDKEGETKEYEGETRIHKGKRVSIDYTSKQFHTITSSDPNPFPGLPINPFGSRMLHTLHTPLSDFLKFPEITSSEGEDEIDGERVIVFKIGPNIPTTVRPTWTDDATVTVWLAPARHYLPMRTEIRRKRAEDPDEVIRLNAGSFQDVPDLARETTVPFPHQLEIEWPSGWTKIWVVESAAINPKVSERDFVMSAPPTGYFVTVDGKAKFLSGGAKQRDETVRQSVAEAKRLLGSLDPPRSSATSWLTWPLALVLVAVFSLSLVFFFKWRTAQ
ncbi:MAG: hypothetical protein WD872_19290 [Pirellulaceae bacterium]